MEATDLRVAGFGGIDLHILEWSREGVPLLLLHGFGNEAHIWDDFAPVVAPYYRTLALDQRGHGQSDWAKDAQGYALDVLVDDVEAVTDALGAERLVLVAHSLGGHVATLFAGRHPERIAGLVLVDSGPEHDPRGRLRMRQDIESNAAPVYAGVDEYARELQRAYPAAAPDVLGRMARHGLRARDAGGFELAMDPTLRSGALDPATDDPAAERALQRRMWDALAALPCPVLVVRGAASDFLSPEIADRMVDDVLQRGQLAVVPRAGHSVMTDNPAGFAEAVAGFVLSD